MKLRRAMVAAAAAAALAPVSLSAPAAFATEGTAPSPGASESATPTPPATPSETPSTSTSPTPSASASTTPSGDGNTKPSKPAEPAKSKEPTKPTESTESTGPGDPGDRPKDCPVGEDGVDPDSQLDLAVHGLPSKIVAGSGWHRFTLTATNRGDEDLSEVNWLAVVDAPTGNEDEEDWLTNFADLQYFDPETESWEPVDGGIYSDVIELGAKETATIKLRFAISEDAPTGEGYALGVGSYPDSELNCTHSSDTSYDFTVLKPGSHIDYPAEAIPDKGRHHVPTGLKKPLGDAKKVTKVKKVTKDTTVRPTGSLARTGTGSMLPTVALVGGIAVVAGAGTVFAVRRRKGGNATA